MMYTIVWMNQYDDTKQTILRRVYFNPPPSEMAFSGAHLDAHTCSLFTLLLLGLSKAYIHEQIDNNQRKRAGEYVAK